jgi:hypothetical protein
MRDHKAVLVYPEMEAELTSRGQGVACLGATHVDACGGLPTRCMCVDRRTCTRYASCASHSDQVAAGPAGCSCERQLTTGRVKDQQLLFTKESGHRMIHTAHRQSKHPHRNIA